VDQFPGEVVFNYTIANIKRRGAIILGTGFLRGDFETAHVINVLLFGMKGTGKSSLLNSLLTSLSMGIKRNSLVTVAKQNTHVTLNYQKISIGENIKDSDNDNDLMNDRTDKKNIKFQIFDPWGDSDQDYKQAQIKHLLQGQIPPGTPRNISDDCITEPIKKNVIHCVCFVIPIGFVLEDDDVKTHVRGTMEKVIALGYQPMIVVTRIDEIEQIELREELQDRLIAMVPASPNNILFHQNYHSENIRVNSIDLSSRKILNTMKSLALTQIKILGGKNFLTSFDQNIETVFTLQQKIIIDGSGKKFLEGEFNENKIKETEKIKENKIKETELSIWLESLKISEEIISNFSDLGATEINDILDLEEEDWTNVKVSPFIQKKILKKSPKWKYKDYFRKF